MTNQQIGISEQKTFRITLPGEDPYTFEGTPEQALDHIDSAMEGRNGVPHVEDVSPVPARASRRAAVEAGPDPEGAGRSTADLLAAQAAGFAPARPYYDRGTPVIGLGVENARESAREHEAKPRVSEAVEQFVGHIEAENRRDVVTPIRDLMMRDDGSIVGEGGARWLIEPPALPQLATRVGIEQPAYLAGVWPHLRAQNWNQHIATIRGHEASTCPAGHPASERLQNRSDVTAKLRLRNGGSREPSIWAAVSERYGVFDVDQIAESLAVGMRDLPDARCEISYDGSGAQFDVLFHSDVQPERYVAGEFFKAGIRVRTSDSGGGSISIGTLLFQNLCLNLIMIDQADFSIDRIRHLGDPLALSERFKAAVHKANRQLDHFLRAWGYATGETLCERSAAGYKPEHVRLLDEMATETVSEIDLLSGIFLGLGKSGAVSVNRKDIPGLLAAHARDESGATLEAPITRASVVNAITRHAHEHVGRENPGRQQSLEREAGNLLVSGRGGTPAPLPFLPPKPRETVHAR